MGEAMSDVALTDVGLSDVALSDIGVDRASAEGIAKDIEAYRERGGPDLEEEHLALAQTPEEREAIRAAWIDARERRVIADVAEAERKAAARAAEREAKAAELVTAADADNSTQGWGKRRSWGEGPATSKKDEGFFKKPDVQPKAVITPEPQPSKTLVPAARFGNEQPRAPDTVPATLAQSSPYDTAKEYVRRHCFREGVLATYFWQDQFWKWNGRYYEAVEPQIIHTVTDAFLDGSQKFVGGGDLTRFKPTPKLVNDVLDALKAGLALPAECQPPIWLDSREPATDVLTFRNGLVNVLEWGAEQ
jgi:hypothetical protein